MRVAVTKVGDQIQVSYTNPPYLADAYRMAGDLKDTAAKLQAALGRVEEFGAKGLTPATLASTTTCSAWSIQRAEHAGELCQLRGCG